MIKYIPKEVQSFDQVQNDLNAFIPPLEFLKQRMTKSLVNYEAIRKELLIKVDKDILNLLKRII